MCSQSVRSPRLIPNWPPSAQPLACLACRALPKCLPVCLAADPLHPCQAWRRPALLCMLCSVRAVQNGAVPGALNLPVSSLRDRMDEVPRNKLLYVYCQVRACAHLVGH